MMSGFKLYYFNARGGAETCRLAFAAANIEYEDIRLDGDKWAEEKASGRPPFGQMPFIVTPEGNLLAQSAAIMKYICKKGGLSPTDSFDEAIADMVTDGVKDVFQDVIKFFLEKDEIKKEKLKKEFFENTFPAKLQKFQAILKDRNEGKDFFTGDKLSYADITFFNMCNVFANGEPKVPEQLNKFPLLVDHYNRVLNVPGIKAWVEKRPKTER